MNTDPSVKTASRPRFLLLDLLRLMAALAVVIYHYTARNQSQWDAPTSEKFQTVSEFSAYGFLGVQLFFLISGFVILLSAEGRTIGEFVSARVSRLFPAYWAGVILTTVLIVLIAPQFGRSVSVGEFLANLTMAQSAYGVQNIDGVYWTLWVELSFYVLIGLLIASRLTEAKVYWFAFLWPLAGAVAGRTDAGFLSSILSPAYAPLFAGGMMLYIIHSRGHNLLRWLLLLFNMFISVQQTVAYDLLKGAPRNTGQDLSPTVGAVLVILMFAVVAMVTITPMKYKGWAWMTYAGALTYPLYLIHENWGWWMIGLVNPIAGKWAAVLAALAVSFLLAIAIERWVERPVRPRMRRALQRSFDAIPTRSQLAAEPELVTARQ